MTDQLTEKQKVAQIIDDLNTGKRSLSFSSIKQFSKSPRDMVNYLSWKGPDTDAMQLSSMVHCVVLEGIEVFYTLYSYLPIEIQKPTSKQGNAACVMASEGASKEDVYRQNYSLNGKSENAIEKAVDAWAKKYEKYIEFLINANGKQVVTQYEFELALEINKTLLSDEFIVELLRDTDREVKFDECMIDGIPFRGILDVLEKDKSKAADLKIYANVEPRRFKNIIFYDLLHVQGAIYCLSQGIPFEDGNYHIIAADKFAGNVHYQVFNLSADVLQAGYEKLLDIIKYFKHCRLLGAWHKSYGFFSDNPDGVVDVHVPSWII